MVGAFLMPKFRKGGAYGGSRIKGITVEIGGDTTKLQTALKGVNAEIKNTQSQLKDVEKLLKLDPGNTELLAQKQKLLSSAVSETKEKLATLKTAAEQANQSATAVQKIASSGEKLKSAGETVSSAGEKLLPVTGAIKGIGAATSGMGIGMAWSDERIENIVIPAAAENIMTM